MKRQFYLLFMLLFASTAGVYAQDLIIKRNGEEIEAVILETNAYEINYKRSDNPDGPIYIIPKSEVLLIRYANGTKDIFDQTPQNNYYAVRPVDYGTDGKVHPGMRYRQYRKLYSPAAYVPQPTDQYYPWLSGFSSLLIPGLGQMICDEIGRGMAFLIGGKLGSMAVIATGSHLDNDYPVLGNTLVWVGILSFVSVDVVSMVDAVRVAKRKNMYNQDMLKMTSEVDIRLSPYLSTVNTGTVCTPVAGFSLGINF